MANSKVGEYDVCQTKYHNKRLVHIVLFRIFILLILFNLLMMHYFLNYFCNLVSVFDSILNAITGWYNKALLIRGFCVSGRYADVQIANYLIDKGRASVHITTEKGACALHGAALQGNLGKTGLPAPLFSC